MTRLSELLTEEVFADLRALVGTGAFPGVTLGHTLEFLKSDGIMPESGLPVSTFLRIEDWVRERAKSASDDGLPPGA